MFTSRTSLRASLALAAALVAAACSETADPLGVQVPPVELDLPTASSHLAGADPIAYTLSWHDGEETVSVEVAPIEAPMSIADYYDYQGDVPFSSNTFDDLEESDTFQGFLYENTLTGDMSLVFLVDDTDGSSFTLRLVLDGLPAGATWTVRDEPNEGTWTVAGGHTEIAWSGGAPYNDGGALSGDFHEPFEIDFGFSNIAGITAFQWRSPDGEDIPAVVVDPAFIQSLHLSAAPAPDDADPPVITFSGNEGTYELSDDVAITCEATDDGSGLDTVDCPEAVGPAYTFGVGVHTLEATATDLAGNTAEASTSFEVLGDVGSVEALILAWIPNRGVANALIVKLHAADRAAQRGNARAAEGAIGAFENQVRALTGRWLTQEQADFLLALY